MKYWIEQSFIIALVTAFIAACALLAGCSALNNISAGLPGKAVSLNGTMALTKIGMDTEKIPVIFSMVNSGDYTSIPAGMEFIKYKYSKDASIINSEATSESELLIYGSSNPEAIQTILNTKLPRSL